jgi:nitrite reductase (NADH) small subunit
VTPLAAATAVSAGAGPVTRGWVPVCPVEAIVPDTGVTVLIGGVQIAVFLLADGSVRAIDAHDPCSGANVLGRGIVGEVDGVDVVASPVHKQRFALTDGRCLDEDGVRVATHPVRVREGRVQLLAG